MSRTKWRETFKTIGICAETKISIFLFYDMKSSAMGDAAHHKFGFLKCDATLKDNIIGINHALVG